MSPTVLVVDDSRTIRQVVEMALKASPFEVVGAASAREGMQAATAQPAVILLDYHMPDASGYEVCRALKGDAGTAHIPVIMLGGRARNFSESEARSAGADDVVMKPFLTDTLLNAIERAAGPVQAAGSAAARPAPGFASPSMPSAPSAPPAPSAASAAPAFAPPSPPPARPAPPLRPDPLARLREAGVGTQSTPPAPSQPRTPGQPMPGRSAGSQPRIATPDVNASTRAQEIAATPASSAPAPSVDSGVSNIGMSRAEIETLVKDEVQAAVKEQLPGLLRTVMGEVFQKKILPKLVEHGEQRVDAIVESRMNQRIAEVVRMELERLLSEE